MQAMGFDQMGMQLLPLWKSFLGGAEVKSVLERDAGCGGRVSEGLESVFEGEGRDMVWAKCLGDEVVTV